LNPLKKLASQTAIYGLSSVIGRLLNYLLVPLYTRYFLPEEYAVVIEMYAYVAFLVIVLTYGLETAFFRFSKKENDGKVVYSTALISLIISSFIFMLLDHHQLPITWAMVLSPDLYSGLQLLLGLMPYPLFLLQSLEKKKKQSDLSQ
jgi:O-antigen/teichoic acid export membrane protein